ncbi:MAG TPA: hypothetical protein ENK25_07220 [Bacteroidetes bacterium]|nr:hypothetical protein [Bacteroidota bacterium]
MKTRPVIILICTLVLGFLLGMATSAWIRHSKMKDFRAFNSIEAFRVRTLSILDPTPEQKEKIVPVIIKYGQKNFELRKKYREEFIVLMKEYRDTLYPLLTREQIERLEMGPLRGREDDRGRRDREGGKDRDDFRDKDYRDRHDRSTRPDSGDYRKTDPPPKPSKGTLSHVPKECEFPWYFF